MVFWQYKRQGKVIQSTYYLNKVLHRHNIRENLRSLLVGTCLLALKNGLVYENYEACMIVSAIKSNLGKMLERTYDYATKASKVKVIEEQLLESQDVESLTTEGFYEILDIINNDILPYINDEHTKGQDILSMFFPCLTSMSTPIRIRYLLLTTSFGS